MAPQSKTVSSRLEWLSNLTAGPMAALTEETKFLRKVRLPWLSMTRRQLTTTNPDSDYCYHWYERRCFTQACFEVVTAFIGPKVNSVEKLAELRKAGVNVGTSSCSSFPVL